MAGCPAALVLKKRVEVKRRTRAQKFLTEQRKRASVVSLAIRLEEAEGQSGSHSMKKRGAENACACGSGGRGVSNGVTSSGARLAKQHRALLKLA